MDDFLINKLYALKDKIKETPEYKRYMECEEKLNNSDDVAILAYRKDIAIVDYEDSLKHFNKNSPEALKSKMALAKSNQLLCENETVKEYLDALHALNALLEDIQNILFGDWYAKSSWRKI